MIKDWLWFTKDREGGRKKPELEKKKKQDNAIENGNDNDNESEMNMRMNNCYNCK